MTLPHQRIRSTVSVKITLVALGVLVAMLGALILVLVSEVSDLNARSGQSRIRQEARLIERQLAWNQEEMLRATRSAVALSFLRTIVEQDNAAGARMMLDADREIGDWSYDHIELLVASGESLASSTRPIAELGGQPVAARALAGEAVTSLLPAEEGSPLLVALAPVRDESGEVIGALVLGRRLDDDFVAEFVSDRTDIQIALTSGGRVVAAAGAPHDAFDGALAALPNQGATELVLAPTLGHSAAGDPLAYGAMPLGIGEPGGGQILIQIDMAPMARFQQEVIGNILLLIAIAGLVGLGIISLVIQNLIARPLSRLRQVAEQVAAGHYDQRATVGGSDEIGQLARAFNSMAGSIEKRTEELETMNQTLEAQVRARTQAIEQSSEISRRLSMLLDPEQVRQEVVEQVKLLFGYAHAQVFMIEPRTNSLVLRSATGEVGQQLRRQRHRVPLGRGLVGRAADQNRILFSADVSREPAWEATPLLPDTCAEIAVPISFRDEVLGVLDIQHNVPNELRAGDAALLSIIANQVAIALRNARLFTEAQQAAERETLINAIGLKIQQAATVEQVLQIATLELGQAIAPTRASLTVGQNHRQKSSETR